MDDFKVLLVDVANEICDDELTVLKYFSEDILTGSSIDGINSAIDLFNKLLKQLDERGCKAFLFYVFSQMKNYTVRNMLGEVAEDGRLQKNPLRKLLFEISEGLNKEEWTEFKFLLPDQITKRDKEKGRIAILSILMKRLPECSLVEVLKRILRSRNRQDLLAKVNLDNGARETVLYRRTSPHGQEECTSTYRQEENASSNLHAQEYGEGLQSPQSSNNNNIYRSPGTSQQESSTQQPSGQSNHNQQLNQQPAIHVPIVQPDQQPSLSQPSSNIIHVGRFSYDLHQKIDRSLSADVYRGKTSDMDIAVKVISKIRRTDDFIQQSLQECEILKNLEQQNEQQHFLKYYGYETQGNTFLLGLELYEWTLKEYINKKKLEKGIGKQKCRSLAMGVEFLHSKQIIHRGINPYNIFVIEYPEETLFKIGNLGSCERIDSRNEVVEDGQNCLKYIAKEVLQELDRAEHKKRRETLVAREAMERHDNPENVDYIGQLNFSIEADIFALGCVFYFILSSGYHPYSRTNFSDDKSILKGCNPVLKELDKKRDCHLIELIQSMISHKKEERPTAARVCMYPAFMKDHDILSMYFQVSNKLNQNVRQTQKRKFEDQSILPGRTRNWLDNIPVEKLKSTLTNNSCAKYDGEKVESLLRAIRNTVSHLNDWSKNVQKSVKNFPGGVLAVWNVTCPKLLVHVYDTVRELKWDEEKEFEFMKF